MVPCPFAKMGKSGGPLRLVGGDPGFARRGTGLLGLSDIHEVLLYTGRSGVRRKVGWRRSPLGIPQDSVEFDPRSPGCPGSLGEGGLPDAGRGTQLRPQFMRRGRAWLGVGDRATVVPGRYPDPLSFRSLRSEGRSCSLALGKCSGLRVRGACPGAVVARGVGSRASMRGVPRGPLLASCHVPMLTGAGGGAGGLGPTLQATQGQMDGFYCQLPYKCHLPEVASVGD